MQRPRAVPGVLIDHAADGDAVPVQAHNPNSQQFVEGHVLGKMAQVS
jgi:hypothetical protein